MDFGVRFKEMIPHIVFERPWGLTAKEIAEIALERGFLSTSKDPIGSLATTVHQQVRNNWIAGVVRGWEGEGKAGDPLIYVPAGIEVHFQVRLDVKIRSKVTGQHAESTSLGEDNRLTEAQRLAVADACTSITEWAGVPDMYEPYWDMQDMLDWLTKNASSKAEHEA